MEKSYVKEIVRVISDKQEIEKNYSVSVAQVQGFIHLDMDDFYAFANKYKLVMEVVIDSPASVSDQMKTAVSEIKKHGIGKVSAMILSISYKPSSPLVMGELRWDDLIDYKETEFKRGIQENDNIFNYRSISLFVFE